MQRNFTSTLQSIYLTRVNYHNVVEVESNCVFNGCVLLEPRSSLQQVTNALFTDSTTR